jgi:hypothetical protein
MKSIADDAFEQMFQCCTGIATIDPEQGVNCYDDLRDWRGETATLILQWYQACLNGNQDLAEAALGALRGLLQQASQSGCGEIQLRADGQWVATVSPFLRGDRITVTGLFAGSFGSVRINSDSAAADGQNADGGGSGVAPPSTWTLGAGEVSLALSETGLAGGGLVLTGTMHGAFTVGAPVPPPPSVPGDGAVTTAAVSGLELVIEVGGQSVRLSLDDPRGIASLSGDGHSYVLAAPVSLDVPDSLPGLTPSTLWLTMPLTATDEGLVVDVAQAPAATLFPVSLGWADWDRDGDADVADVASFYADSGKVRDLNLDGVFDGLDVRLFVHAWRAAQ